MTRINMYDVCLFNRGGFPCLWSLARAHPTTLFPPPKLPTTDYGGIKKKESVQHREYLGSYIKSVQGSGKLPAWNFQSLTYLIAKTV
jgi:hypothetical protein